MDSLTLYAVSFCAIVATISAVSCLWWAFSQKRKTARDIIENVNETIVIFDSYDKPCYINITIKQDGMDESDFLKSLENEINRSGRIPEDLNTACLDAKEPIILEGEIKPRVCFGLTLSWKMCPVVCNGRYMGRIYVFNDITQYVTLQEQLDEQNKQLKAALEDQRRYAAISQKLSSEEERERIMGIINLMAKEYLGQLYKSIAVMENNAFSDPIIALKKYEAENEKMIQLTRETIREVRQTVKELHAVV